MENRNQVLAANTQDAYWGMQKMNPKNREEVKANPEKYSITNNL
jgi:hypothetical protein